MRKPKSAQEIVACLKGGMADPLSVFVALADLESQVNSLSPEDAKIILQSLIPAVVSPLLKQAKNEKATLEMMQSQLKKYDDFDTDDGSEQAA